MGVGASASASTRGHPITTPSSPPRQGDLLRFPRGLYSHWGVCLGTGAHLERLPSLPESLRDGVLHDTTTYVGHLTAVAPGAGDERGGDDCDFGGNNAHVFVTKLRPLSDIREMAKPSVEVLHAAGTAAGAAGFLGPSRDPLDAMAEAEPAVMVHALPDVARGGRVEIANDVYDAYFAEVHGIEQPLPSEEIVKRALRCHGLRGYSLLGRNCEHFASWLRYGAAKSMQADDAKTGAVRGAAAAVGAVVGGAAAAAAGGAVAVAAAVAVGGAVGGALAVAAAAGTGAEAVRGGWGGDRGGRRRAGGGSLYHEYDGASGVGAAANGGSHEMIASEWEASQALASRENRL